ncbi:MAG: PD-(D/E)XK nuclease family transposase [Erysipelotrichaceae bacterium]|nr:PD-(D/E)XK nuclease family transposase [Erysipelotrichaceae bacterium]
MRKEVTDMLTNHETEKKKVQEEEMSEILDYDNDVFFKFALGTEDEDSAFIRNTIIEHVTGIHPKESTVLNPNLDPAILRRKKIVLDVHVKDCDGREYDIEMQTTYSKKSEMKRFEFYGARMLSNQVISGGKYQNLLPVFQIIFIDSYADHSRRLIDSYQMRNEQGAVESSHPLMKRIYIYLPEIDVIARKKGFANMTDFEQLCLVLPSGYLFKNNDSE